MDRVGDLSRQLFLYLQPVAIGVDHTRQLADPDHAPVRQICDMGASDNRHHVMLAVTFNTNVAQEYDLVVSLHLFECSFEDCYGVLLIPIEEL